MTNKLSENTVYRLKVLGGIAAFAVVATAFLIVYFPGFQEELELIFRAAVKVLNGG